ncbi:MAG: GDP-mannose 4,6-dehydratase [Acidobacteriales bacterium]|nr:GDP-mannose 4,6-dehydratase [Terriglobales bacterium]
MNNIVPFRSVLIFGGAGFVGSNWAHYLLENTDAAVHVFDNLSRPGVQKNLAWLQNSHLGLDRLKVTVADIRDSAAVQRAVNAASEIYHFAAQVAVTTSVNDPREDFDINVGGTLNILEAARNSGHRPFLLFTSTNKVYGNLEAGTLVRGLNRYENPQHAGTTEAQPLDFYSPYGCSKGAADQYVHDYSRIYGLPTVVFRMSCIAGPHQFGNEDQGWLAHFLYSAISDVPITIFGDGRQVRDVLSVDDLLRAFDAVRGNLQTTAGQVYNVGGGPRNAVSLLQVIDEVERIVGRRPRLRTAEARPGDQLYYVTNYEKLRRAVGWQPRHGVRQVLERMHEWWRRYRDGAPELPVGARSASMSALAPEAAS